MTKIEIYKGNYFKKLMLQGNFLTASKELCSAALKIDDLLSKTSRIIVNFATLKFMSAYVLKQFIEF